MTLRLGAMMFLQYFIQGAWYVTVGNYMTTLGMTNYIYLAYTMGPIAAVISPFFLGLVADRYFAAEKVLAVLSLLGGLAMYGVSGVKAGQTTLFILLLLAHCLCYFPTVALTSTLAFHAIRDRESQFPAIRIFGSIGWIAAGIIVSGILKSDFTALPLKWAAGSSVVLALYSLTLPHTPPQPKTGKRTIGQLLGLDAIRWLMNPSFAVFLISFIAISLPVATFGAYAPIFLSDAGIHNPAYTMSYGQMAEVAVVFIMPLLLRRIGIKWTIVAGLAAWGLRYLFFAAAVPNNQEWMLLTAILMQGFCFNFVYISGLIYIDRKADVSIRGQAQGFLVVIQLGIGLLIGTPLAGLLFNHLVVNPVQHVGLWQNFWLVPAVFSFLVTVYFGKYFKDDG